MARISSRGRVTIPVELRLKYNIKPKTKITFIEKDGKLILQPINRKYFDELAGMLGLKGKMLKSLMEDKKKFLR